MNASVTTTRMRQEGLVSDSYLLAVGLLIDGGFELLSLTLADRIRVAFGFLGT